MAHSAGIPRRAASVDSTPDRGRAKILFQFFPVNTCADSSVVSTCVSSVRTALGPCTLRFQWEKALTAGDMKNWVDRETSPGNNMPPSFLRAVRSNLPPVPFGKSQWEARMKGRGSQLTDNVVSTAVSAARLHEHCPSS